jgi:transposase
LATRAAFLSDQSHRIRFVYIPKHTSWLNQIECWFSILVRRLLKRSSFTSTEHLKHQILDFIDYFNRTLAKPFVWKFVGFPESD